MPEPDLVACRACGQLVKRTSITCLFCGARVDPNAAPAAPGPVKPARLTARTTRPGAGTTSRTTIGVAGPRRAGRVAVPPAMKDPLLVSHEARVRESLARDPAWQVSAGSAWFCPYCGRAAVEDLSLAPEPTAAVLRHLERCKEWKRFEGVPLPAETLRDRAFEQGMLRALERGIAEDLRFHLRGREGQWVCPWCAGPTPVPASEDQGPGGGPRGKALEHVRDCAGYRDRQGEPLSLARLEAALDPARGTAPGTEASPPEAALVSSPIWRLVDEAGGWICPFCAGSTDLPEGEADPGREPARARVLDHLRECAGYAGGSGRPLSPDRLRRALAAANDGIREAHGVAQQMASDPVWSVADPGGRWICPHCREPVPRLLAKEGPRNARRVLLHLRQHCPGARAGRPAAANVEELLRGRIQAEAAGGRPEALWRAARAQQELLREMEHARALQRRLLPPVPRIDGIEFAARYRPSEDLGGDLYDFVELGGGDLGVVIGDISGHGLEAALLMGMVKKLIHLHAREADSPAEVLRRTDRDLREDLPRDVFVTALYGILSPQARRFTFSRAGHPHPALLRPRSTPPATLLKVSGVALGLGTPELVSRTLEDRAVFLAPGDALLLLTDGVFEAQRGGEEFGIGRILSLLLRGLERPLDEVLREIEVQAAAFREATDLGDDMTMVALRVAP